MADMLVDGLFEMNCQLSSAKRKEGVGEGKSYVTGVAAPLPLPPPFPPPRIVELDTSEVDVLKRDILVD